MVGEIIKIAFPNEEQDQELTILVGDVGGTKTNLAIYRVQGRHSQILHKGKFRSADYRSLELMIKEFLPDGLQPDRLSVGVAGPVFDGRAMITNLSWEIDQAKLIRNTGIPQVFVINDLVASAYGLAGLTGGDIMTIHAGDRSVKGNAVIISPGTGLGEGGLFFDGTKYHPFGSEGGHADYAPETKTDIQLFQWLQKKYGHVSWERVVSGKGILEIYAFLTRCDLSAAAGVITEKFKAKDPAAAISLGAREGDSICEQTMQIFLRNLANEAGNLVMKLMGTGGVFIGGGIVPKNLGVLQKRAFVDYFLEAGRMGTLLSKVPVHIVLNEDTALIGANLYGYYNT